VETSSAKETAGRPHVVARHPETYTHKVALQPPVVNEHAASVDHASTPPPVRPERRRKKPAPPPPTPIVVETIVEEVPAESARVVHMREYDAVCDEIVDERPLAVPPHVDAPEDVVSEQTARVVEAKESSRAGMLQLQLAQGEHDGELEFADPFLEKTPDERPSVDVEPLPRDYDVVASGDQVTDTSAIVDDLVEPPSPTTILANREGEGTEPVTESPDAEPVLPIDTPSMSEGSSSTMRPDMELTVVDSSLSSLTTPPSPTSSSRLSDDEVDMLAHFRDAIADGERQLLADDMRDDDNCAPVDGATAAHIAHPTNEHDQTTRAHRQLISGSFGDDDDDGDGDTVDRHEATAGEREEEAIIRPPQLEDLPDQGKTAGAFAA